MRTAARTLAVCALTALGASSLTGCGSVLKNDLPVKSPPLIDMEEPVALLTEPADEATRRELPLGSFTGLSVAEVRRTLEESAPVAAGVRVTRVVENSPADAAGIDEDDDLLAARIAGGAERELRWPSEWRQVELDAVPGSKVAVVLDHAGAEQTTEIVTVPRLRPADRGQAERFREEQKAGVVLRTATEAEARAAGLGPGGGAVIVGLSARSPWRAAGLRFEDLVVAVDGAPVAHPQQLIEAIRSAQDDQRLALEFVRGGERRSAEVAVSRRAQDVHEFSIPLLYSYESSRGTTETSFVLGALRTRSTAAAWEWRILWLFTISGGDADRLVEIEE